MKAVILLAEGFEDLQFFTPYYRLLEEGVEITLASANSNIIRGVHGYEIEPDMPIHELNPAEYELLLIPGGSSPEKLRVKEEAVNLARTFMEEARTVAILGHGAQLLISAGAIDGRAVTCSQGIRDDVRAAGGLYREDAVIMDDNLLSGRDNASLPRFCQLMISRLGARA